MKLTKLQKEYIDGTIKKGSYIAFPLSIFKSKRYKAWEQNKIDVMDKLKELKKLDKGINNTVNGIYLLLKSLHKTFETLNKLHSNRTLKK